MKIKNGASRCSRGTLSAALLGLLLLAPNARSAEGGLSNFPFGAQTSYAAMMPAAGTTSFFGYALMYKADSVRDNNGDRIPGVEVEVIALAPRLVHSWEKSLWGFKLSSGVVLEGIYANVKVPGAEDSDSGPTLLGIEPLYLTKSVGAWHFLTGPLIYLPQGNYNRNKLANSNLNYGALAYQVSTTWTPTADWDISLNLAAEWKEKNDETDYRSGVQSGLTYGVSNRPFANKKWDLGISGFYSYQLTDDHQAGVDLPGGAKTRKLAIGPKVAYWITPAAGIVAMWHRETAVRNAPQGDLFWLECAFPF